jgi:hypothetical protein
MGRKRARALTCEPPSEARVVSNPGASAGRCGDSATRWNHHARTLRAKGRRAGLKGAARSTKHGDGEAEGRTTEVAARAASNASEQDRLPE